MSNNTQNSCVVAITIAVVAVIFQVIFGEQWYNVHLSWGMMASVLIVFAVGLVRDVRAGVNPFKNNSGD